MPDADHSTLCGREDARSATVLPLGEWSTGTDKVLASNDVANARESGTASPRRCSLAQSYIRSGPASEALTA